MDMTRSSSGDEATPKGRTTRPGTDIPAIPATVSAEDEATSSHSRDSQRDASHGVSDAEDPHREAQVEVPRSASSSSRPSRAGDPARPRTPGSEARPALATPSPTSLLLAIRQILREEVGPIVREEIAQFQKSQAAEQVQQQHQQQQQRQQRQQPLLEAPVPDPKADVDVPVITEPLVKQAIAEDDEEPSPPATSPKQLTVRFSEPFQDDRRKESRQPSSSSSRTRVELSVVDQKWGVLFDKKGQPTPRLEQVLKGLANYIIEEFMPRKSIVVTPEKLVHLYKFPRVDREQYPWARLFASKAKGFNSILADLYDDLGCEYHLIPGEEARSRPPRVPSLTPKGFAQWMTQNILAYPDVEARRMERIASHFPVDADSPSDGAPERLPKQLSRHLFPDRADKTARSSLDRAMKDFIAELAPPPPLPLPPPPTTQPLRSRRESAHIPRDRRQSIATSPKTQSGPLASYIPYLDEVAAPPYDRDRRSSATTTTTTAARRESYNSRTYEPPCSPTTNKRASISGGTTTIITNTLPTSPPPLPPPAPPPPPPPSSSQISTLPIDMPRPPIGRQQGSVPKRARSPQRQDYRHSLPQIHNSYHYPQQQQQHHYHQQHHQHYPQHHHHHQHPPPPSPSVIPSIVVDPTFEMPSAHSRELRDKTELPYRLYDGRDAARAATPDGGPAPLSSPLSGPPNDKTVAPELETWADYHALQQGGGGGGGTRGGGYPSSLGG